MKKATSHAVVTKPYSFGVFQVMAVTTRKANGRVYGRTLDGEATNRASRDVVGHYATEGDAKAAVERIQAARDSFQERLAELEKWRRDVERQRDDAVKEAAKVGRVA